MLADNVRHWAGRGADVTLAGVAELWQWPQLKPGVTLRCGNGLSGGMFLQKWRIFQVRAISCTKVIVSLERAVKTANLAIIKNTLLWLEITQQEINIFNHIIFLPYYFYHWKSFPYLFTCSLSFMKFIRFQWHKAQTHVHFAVCWVITG